MSTDHPAIRTVVVVDDHRTFTELLTMALDAHDRLTCVGSATDLRAAMSMLERVTPDLVIMDYRLGRDDGLDATRQVTQRWPQVAVVVLTAFPTKSLMHRAAEAGASALLPKDGSLDELLEVLVTAQPGRFALPPALLQMLMIAGAAEVTVKLTSRELDVLHGLAQGQDVRRVSRDLGITVNTTRGHVKTILVKLDAHTQLEAVAAAYRLGILQVAGTP